MVLALPNVAQIFYRYEAVLYEDKYVFKEVRDRPAALAV